MQDTMEQQEIQFTFKRILRLTGITRGGFCRDNHITEQIGLDAAALTFLHGKRNNVGGSILVQVVAINLLDSSIINNQNRKMSLRTCRGA
jgi:hypothetical protein